VPLFEATTEGELAMTDNLLINIPEIRLPRDMAWRVKFIEAVEQHARRLGIAGHFTAPRFFGYYFTGTHPVVVAGHWTVMLDEAPLLRRLRQTIDRVTEHRFTIASQREGMEPEFMLVHDRHDGSCWLWDYFHGRRFLEASEPVTTWSRSEDVMDENEDSGPKLLGP
jgi:hypothetical protein